MTRSNIGLLADQLGQLRFEKHSAEQQITAVRCVARGDLRAKHLRRSAS